MSRWNFLLKRDQRDSKLDSELRFHIDARVALLKSYDEDVEDVYRDYKKFRTDTKITVVGEENKQ